LRAAETVIRYSTDLAGVDWIALKNDLAGDRFDNGRSPEQLRRSFENSYAVVFARDVNGRIIGKARVISDGVCNAYIVDVWTHTSHRRRGVASTMMKMLLSQLSGQHVYLVTDDRMDFYKTLGFVPQLHGLSLIVGTWLRPK
jgi:predicted GNAT family acetyltransferase